MKSNEKSDRALRVVASPKSPPDSSASSISPPLDGAGLVDPRPYSVFTRWQRHGILACATAAAFFSPLTGQIYLPGLPTLADEFDVSYSMINLTITFYMVFQGLTPMLIAGFADSAGRRPVYIICFSVYVATNIALALSPTFAFLLAFRMLQSAGAAVTIALNQAVLSDLATSAERGKFMGYTVFPSILAPSIGPVLGGVLAEKLGWRWIFWFLAISGGIVLAVIILFLPETCRNVVDDGSVTPPRLYRTGWQIFQARRRRRRQQLQQQQQQQQQQRSDNDVERDGAATTRTLSRRGAEVRIKIATGDLLSSFRLMGDLEMFILLIQVSIMFAGFYAMLTTLPSQLVEDYNFTPLKVGLMYLPLGGGTAFAVPITGRLIDGNYRRHAAKQGVTIVPGRQPDTSRLPLERARLEIALPALALMSCIMYGWGWALEHHAHISVLCVLMFLLGAAMTSANNASNILIIDCSPLRPAASIAANNVTRCTVGAGMTAAIQPLIGAVGQGVSFTIIGSMYFGCVPLAWWIMTHGMDWRRKRLEREKEKEKEKRGNSISESEPNGLAEKEEGEEASPEHLGRIEDGVIKLHG